MLPQEYDPRSIESKFNSIESKIQSFATRLELVPLDAAPPGAKDGWLAISDGTSSGFDGTSGAGLYRYNGSSWVFVG